MGDAVDDHGGDEAGVVGVFADDGVMSDQFFPLDDERRQFVKENIFLFDNRRVRSPPVPTCSRGRLRLLGDVATTQNS